MDLPMTVDLLSLQEPRARLYLLLFLSVATRGPSTGKSLRSSSLISYPGVQRSRNRAGLDAGVLVQRGRHGDADKSHFAANLSCSLSVDSLSLQGSWGPGLCLCVAEGAQGSRGEDCASF